LFIALKFSISDMIRQFGEAGLAATVHQRCCGAVRCAGGSALLLVPQRERVFAVKFQAR